MKITVPLGALKGVGLGDVVRKVTTALGIKKGCGGCEKRRKSLNRFKLPK